MAGAGGGESTLLEYLQERGLSRRTFLKYCSGMAATLALPPKFAPKIAKALATQAKPIVIWQEFQDCAGNSESFLRARDPNIADIVLDILSVDYHETIMAAAGKQAEDARAAALAKGGHILVVEGSIPLNDGGVYCMIGGRSAIDLVKEAAKGAAAVIAVGSCSSYGGLPAASPNPTGAVGVANVVSGVPVINLPGCPANVENITATIVHYLTFKALPATDAVGRPLFAYGDRIHDNCPRRGHFDAGQFVQEWGDEGHKRGYCLYRMGCKGPSTFHNCPTTQWNAGTNWPIGGGHGCAGCSEPHFWDTMTPIYRRLPRVPGFGVEASADKIGLGLVGATAVAFAGHGVAKTVKGRISPATVSAGVSTEGDEE